ncbi:MAG: ankyrin repeat domain-containing protein [Gemmatimonadaceae bacterium]
MKATAQGSPGALDALFQEAVAAIDAGDVTTLERLTQNHPELVRERLAAPGAWLRDKAGAALSGFFAEPYLLWFVAEDPVRNDSLPENIAQIAHAIIAAARREHVVSLQQQLDYALRLVAWSWVAHRGGVQLQLIDVLLDAGASSEGVSDDALVNGHAAAAERLLERGAKATLATALCLGRWQEAERLAGEASPRAKQMALTLAALNGKSEALVRLIALGDVDVNAASQDLYSHAAPLHHAVASGSLDAIAALVQSGASLAATDAVHGATPVGWAEHFLSDAKSDDARARYAAIGAYLADQSARRDSIAGPQRS